MDDFEHPTISLLLTRRCNFQCDHCFYECGPNYRGYMSDAVLRKVRTQVERLNDLGLGATINLVGGEPTLNMDRFKEILDEVMRWGNTVEMTTNGWWFHQDKTAVAFFNAVGRHIDADECGESFCVRISDDVFHDQYRPDWIVGKMERELSRVFDFGDREIFYKAKYECLNCDKTFKYMPDYEECPKCGDYIETEYEELLNWHIPPPHDGHPWIYVETRKDSYRGISPNGRAEGWGEQDGCSKYSNAGMLSYLPNGKLMDICCKGAWCEFGTVDDDPLLLLALGKAFTEQVKPHCSECRDLAKEWKRKNLRKERARLEKEIEALEEMEYA